MRVVVVGGGVVGITTAYALARRGHTVEVVEREGEVGTGASAVNAGLLVPGDALVWGTPEAPRLLARALTGHGSFLRVAPGAGPELVPWGLRFLRECTPRRMRDNIAAVHALAAFGYDELRAIFAREPGIATAARGDGMVFLFGTRAALDAGLAARRPLADLGERYDVLTRDELVALDAAFAHAAERVAGAVHAPSCGSADCGAFTRALAQRARALGVALHLGAPVTDLVRDRSGRVTGVRTAAAEHAADVTVLAAGAWTARLARPLGHRLPIIPAKGYALTIPVRDAAGVPRVGGVDEDAHVAFSPMDGALRISSTAEFAGLNTDLRATDVEALRAAAERLFGADALDLAAARPGAGLRPSTPSGRPLIGPLGDGLLVNAGHGHLGWTQAAGAAQLLVAHLEGDRVPIDPTPYLP